MEDQTEAALLKMIDTDPTNKTPARLIYIDWLEQNGFKWRASFIRDDIAAQAAPQPHSSYTNPIEPETFRWAIRVLIKQRAFQIPFYTGLAGIHYPFYTGLADIRYRLRTNGFDLNLMRNQMGVASIVIVRLPR